MPASIVLLTSSGMVAVASARWARKDHSYISRVASGVIVGCGTQGYQLALHRLAYLLKQTKQ